MTDTRIYVASLADYNAGNLHGVWIEDCSDVDSIQDQIAEMLRGSKYPNVMVDCPSHAPVIAGDERSCLTCRGSGKVPSAEEWVIHDHEGFPQDMRENPDLDNVAQYARMLAEHGDAWKAYCNNVGFHHATELEFQDTYQGEHDSPEDYAEQLINDCYDVSKMGSLAKYIDYEKFARDLGFDGYSFIDNGSGGVYVFSQG